MTELVKWPTEIDMHQSMIVANRAREKVRAELALQVHRAVSNKSALQVRQRQQCAGCTFHQTDTRVGELQPGPRQRPLHLQGLGPDSRPSRFLSHDLEPGIRNPVCTRLKHDTALQVPT